MRVFLGVTGASGAPYAKRLLEALVAVECEVGVCASKAGVQVLATELYRDPSLPREDVLVDPSNERRGGRMVVLANLAREPHVVDVAHEILDDPQVVDVFANRRYDARPDLTKVFRAQALSLLECA